MNTPVWNESPRTLEEFMISSEAVLFAEQINGGKIDQSQQIVLTLELMRDVARRIRAIEEWINGVG